MWTVFFLFLASAYIMLGTVQTFRSQNQKTQSEEGDFPSQRAVLLHAHSTNKYTSVYPVEVSLFFFSPFPQQQCFPDNGSGPKSGSLCSPYQSGVSDGLSVGIQWVKAKQKWHNMVSSIV